MTGDAVLTVSHLSKKYCQELRRSLVYGLRDIARELRPGRQPSSALSQSEFWALDDVSFELSRGQALAVMGTNGAGKSTLLKLIYGIVKPDRGEARVSGRVEALLELNTGLNPLLTGRENVRLGAALLHLDARESDRLLDEVVDFSELEEFIDRPIQSYSSGMKARLGYSLAAHLKPDLFLVDEILTVGDIPFQHKCIKHMHRYLGAGGTLLLVSHNAHQIQSVCDRGILLNHGRVKLMGTEVEALNAMFEDRLSGDAASHPAIAPPDPVAIEQLTARPPTGTIARPGEPLEIILRYRAEEAMDVLWGFSIWTADQWTCITGVWNRAGVTLAAGGGELRCLLPRVPMVGGRYVVRAAILDPTTRHPIALFGFHQPGITLDLHPEPDPFTNLEMQRNQLVKVDVEWL